MEELRIEYVSVKDLKPYRRNAKKHPREQIDQIKRSIQEFGMDDPIGIWKNGEIIEGHGRLIACQELGIETVPVIRLDHLTDEQRKAYALVHNKLTMNSDFDLDILQSELDSITGIDMDFYSFGDTPQDEQPTEPTDDGYDPVPPAEPKAQYGDIYRLGDHVLMCGDSTKEEDVKKLMDGVLADLFITDPPYNVAIGTKTQWIKKTTGNGIVHDDIKGDAEHKEDEQVAADLWVPAFLNARNVSNDICSIYVTMPQGSTHMTMMQSAKEAGWQVKHELIWVKDNTTFSMGRLDYDYRHEPILYGWNKSHRFYAEDYKNSVLDMTTDIDRLTKDDLKAILKTIIDHSSVIYEAIVRAGDLHPTMKPIPLFGRLIANSSRPGDVVLDLFGGSGTTMIACEQLRRRCYMMEYDPRYVDVIIDRWEQYTGEKAEKIS